MITMLPAATRTAIFASLPKALADGTTVWVDCARRCNVTQKLAEYPVVVTFRYYADRKDQATSPANALFRRDVGITPESQEEFVLPWVWYSRDSIQYTRGERRLVTLSVNVHAQSEALVDEYLEVLTTWYLQTLRTIIGVAGGGDIVDLSTLEVNMERYQMDLHLRYRQEYTETTPVIDFEDLDIDIA